MTSEEKIRDDIYSFVGNSFAVGHRKHGLLPTDPRIKRVWLSGTVRIKTYDMMCTVFAELVDGRSLEYGTMALDNLVSFMDRADKYIAAHL